MRLFKPLAVVVFSFFVLSCAATELKWIHPDQNRTVCVAISDDVIATGGVDGSILLWRRGDRSYIRSLRGYASSIYQMALAADGKALISLESSLDNKKVARVWDIGSGVGTRLPTEEPYMPTDASGVGYLQASNQFFVVASNAKIRFYSALDRTKTGELELGGFARLIALSQDESLLAVLGATSSGYEQIRIVSLADGTFRTSPVPGEGVQALAFSHDGKKLATVVYDDPSILIWDVASGAREKRLTGHLQVPKSVAFNPTRYELVSVSDELAAKVWDVASGAAIRTIPISYASQVVFSKDGSLLAVGNGLLNTASAEVTEIFRSFGGLEAFTPDGRTVITVRSDLQPLLLEATNGAVRGQLQKLPESARYGPRRDNVSFSPGLQSVSFRNQIWSLENGFITSTVAKGPYGWGADPYLTPEWDAYLTSSLESTNVGELRKLSDGSIINLFTSAKSHWSSACAFSADGQKLATVGGYFFQCLLGTCDYVDTTVKLWNRADGTLIREFENAARSEEKPYWISFTADGKYVADATESTHDLVVWETETGNVVFRLHEDDPRSNAVDLFPNSGLLAWATKNGIEIWSLQTSNRVATLSNEEIFDVSALRVSADGRSIAFGRRDGTVAALDVPFGQGLGAALGVEGKLRLRFETGANQMVTVERSGDFQNWTTVTNFPGSAAKGEAEVDVEAAGDLAAFRLKIQMNLVSP